MTPRSEAPKCAPRPTTQRPVGDDPTPGSQDFQQGAPTSVRQVQVVCTCRSTNQCTSPKPARRQPTKRKSQWPATATRDRERHGDTSECTPHCRGPGSAESRECKHGDKRKMGGWEGGGVCCFEGRWGRTQQTQTSQQTRTPPLHWQHGHCTASGRPSGGHRMSLNAWGHWARTTPRICAGPSPRPPCRSNLGAQIKGVERGA